MVPQVNPRPNDFTYILDLDRNRRGRAGRFAKCGLVKRDASPVSRVRHGLGANPVARNLEHEYSPWSQDAQEFLNILATVSGLHVLKNDACIDKVKVIVCEDTQVVRLIEDVGTARAVAIVLVGKLDHRRGNIDAAAVLEMTAECLSQAADAAAEIEGPPAAQRQTQPLRIAQKIPNLLLSGLKEIVQLPLAVAFIGPGKDGPERIRVAKFIPVFL